MGDDIIAPGSGGSASEETRKVVGGWQKMKAGSRETRQQRIIRENEEKSQRIRKGIPEKEPGFRPGEDEASGEVTTRHLKEAAQRLVKKAAQKLTFEGTDKMVTLKLVTLFEQSKNTQIISVEEAGFNKYRLTYFIN